MNIRRVTVLAVFGSPLGKHARRKQKKTPSSVS